MDKEQWVALAAWYEIVAKAFLYPSEELIAALSTGEYPEALSEIIELLDKKTPETSAAIDQLGSYREENESQLLHEMRIEHTRLLIGSPKALVSPYAGVWQAERDGVEPLLFVNKESMSVERFMRSCGVGQPEGTNEPLDHIGSEFEFLHYLALLNAGIVIAPEGVSIPDDTYQRFYQEHVATWVPDFADKVAAHTEVPFFKSMAVLLRA